jgi:hypothetical protein
MGLGLEGNMTVAMYQGDDTEEVCQVGSCILTYVHLFGRNGGGILPNICRFGKFHATFQPLYQVTEYAPATRILFRFME